MKRIIAIAITLIMLLSFAACADGGNVEDSSSSGGVISDVKSDVVSAVSNVGSKASSMMSN